MAGYLGGCIWNSKRNQIKFRIGESYFNKGIYTGSDTGVENGLNLKHNLKEIRPRNQAIRIWIRIK